MIEPDLTSYPKNTTFYWEGTDTEQGWLDRTQSTQSRDYQLLLEYGWFGRPISYDIDNLGFRNPPGVDISNSALALGCSFTFGTGLHREDIWCSKLEKYFGSVYNAAEGGGSADQCYRIARTLIPKYKPKAVFLYCPMKTRTEIISSRVTCGNPMQIGLWNDDSFETYLKIRSGELSQTLQQERNVLSIGNLCRKENIPYVIITSEEFSVFDNLFGTIYMSMGRDLQHPNNPFHQMLADLMMFKYNEVIK